MTTPEPATWPPTYPRSASVAEFASDAFLTGWPRRDSVVLVAITGGSAATTTDTTPTVAGTSSGAETGSTVRVTANSVTYTGTTGSDGSWSVNVTATLALAAYPITVTVTNAAQVIGTATQTLTVSA